MPAAQPTIARNPSPATQQIEAPPSHVRRIDRLNMLLELAWTRGWSARPDLDPDRILRVGSAGFAPQHFFDRTEWISRLRSLTSAIQHEARLSPLGLTIAYGQLVRMVRQRTKLELLWHRNPEILEIPVSPPIIVLGHMRAGTTRMQRMLASDRRLSATRFCDSWHPVPPRGIDWRPAKSWAILKLNGLLNPQFSNIHPTSPTTVDEEIGWLALGFASTPYDAQWHIPSFVKANRARDARSTYALLKRLIQTQQYRGKCAPRPRVLKVPQFMEDLDSVLSVFPDARIVHVTRDRRSVVASSCSLVANQRGIQSNDVDMAQIGREWLDRTVSREKIARQRLMAHPYKMIEVDYVRIEGDWRRAMADIYASLEMGVDNKILNAMECVQRNPDKGHRKHHYRLEDFGLNADYVNKAFATVGNGAA